jgi:cobalt-zinc-cadmium efflux system outer membrane protein
MRFLSEEVAFDVRPRSISFGVGLNAIAIGLVTIGCYGCAAAQQSTSAGDAATQLALRPAPVSAADVSIGDVRGEPKNSALLSGTGAPIIQQVRYSEPQGTPRPAAEASLPEALPAPQAAPTATLTLDQAISVTLQADPKIRAGLEAIHQANADWLTSSLPPNPTLLTDGIFLPLRPITPDRPGGPTQTDVQVGYPIDWFLFGKRAAAMASATLGVRQSEAEYADLIRQRVTTTATAFYDVLAAKSLLDLARQDKDNLTRLEAATRKAVDAGGRPMVEFNRVRLDLLKSQQDLREAESALTIAKAKLRAQFGRTDRDPTFDVDGNLDAPLTGEPLPADEAFAIAQQNRPDIRSLRVQVSKAEADTVVERRKAFPQITPQFGYTRQFQIPIGSPDFDSWDASLTATLPLFDRNQGNRAKAQSVTVQNRYNLQAGLVDLRAEIEEAVQNFSTAYQKAGAVAQEQVKLAAEVRDSIAKAYDVGGRPLIDVLDAERSYRETYRLYISSRADYWRAVYKYNSAIGKQVTR